MARLATAVVLLATIVLLVACVGDGSEATDDDIKPPGYWTPRPVCTPPPCDFEAGEVYHCPTVCPEGCGTICATVTPPPGASGGN